MANLLEIIGNFFTKYNYITTDINYSDLGVERIYSEKSNFVIQYQENENPDFLPKNSPFKSWKESRRFAGPLPNTFSVDEDMGDIMIIEGVRSDWKPKPIEIIDYNFEFLNSLDLNGIHLANAFKIENVPYFWKKGRVEKI
jgi:hypothetical protein